MPTVTSKDHTTIAYTKQGSGPALILVDGALCYRAFGPSPALAAKLQDHFTVYTYDRRGRGESGNTKPYAPEREIEDLAALIEVAGGHARLFGQSSGAMLALAAAAQLGSKVTAVALYEPPLIVDGSRDPMPADFLQRTQDHINSGRPGEAVKMFMRFVGMPGLMVAVMPLMPMWKKIEAIAPTLPYDYAFVAPFQLGQPLPEDRWQTLTTPVLVGVGSKSPKWMHSTNHSLAAALPNAKPVVLPGQTHMVKADVLAPVLSQFFTAPVPAARS